MPKHIGGLNVLICDLCDELVVTRKQLSNTRERIRCEKCHGPVKSTNEYTLRNHFLRKMGFISYEKYLGSALWRTIRTRALVRDNRQCKICKAPTDQVHHLSYDVEVLQGRRDEELISLCADCHQWIEYDENGQKIFSLSQVNLRLERLLKGERPDGVQRKPPIFSTKPKRSKGKGKKQRTPEQQATRRKNKQNRAQLLGKRIGLADFIKYIQEVYKTTKREDQSWGQHMMECLLKTRPAMVDKIRGTPADPSVQDSNIPEFLKTIWTGDSEIPPHFDIGMDGRRLIIV